VRTEPVNEEFFRALETRRTQALVNRDMKILEELHAPEYELITPAGKAFSRQGYLEAIEREPFYASWQAEDMAVRVTAEMAVVRYKAILQFPSGREIVCMHTDTYELRAGRWQAVWSQATELRNAHRSHEAESAA